MLARHNGRCMNPSSPYLEVQLLYDLGNKKIIGVFLLLNQDHKTDLFYKTYFHASFRLGKVK